MKPSLTLDALQNMAREFSETESAHNEPSLFGVTDGKKIGTYLEQKIMSELKSRYIFVEGNSASGIDLPGIEVDIKVTSIKQPQSSFPYTSAKQKIYGLDCHLLVFVYEKTDDLALRTARLNIKHTIFIDRSRTADYQMTTGLRQIIANEGNVEDIAAFIMDKNLPVDEIGAAELAEEVFHNPPGDGYLTISNALQWRLNYGRAIEQAGVVSGLTRIR